MASRTAPVGEALHDADHEVYRLLSAPLPAPLSPMVNALTNAADRSKLSFAQAGLLALAGGARGRRAAVAGVASVVVTSLVANLVVKPIAQRRRPARPDDHHAAIPAARVPVAMPTSTSFPSGHTAAATAFAVAVAGQWPKVALLPAAVAAAVGYSRVHAGVHYPGDVAAGALLGAGIGAAVGQRTVRWAVGRGWLRSGS